jgi:hypothetical protein
MVRTREGKPVFAGRKVVGEVRGDTFYKQVSGAKHFLHRPPAIAFDIASLREAEEYGAVKVHVTDLDDGKVYEATISKIWEQGIDVSRGFGMQVALEMFFWEISEDENAHG